MTNTEIYSKVRNKNLKNLYLFKSSCQNVKTYFAAYARASYIF